MSNDAGHEKPVNLETPKKHDVITLVNEVVRLKADNGSDGGLIGPGVESFGSREMPEDTVCWVQQMADGTILVYQQHRPDTRFNKIDDKRVFTVYQDGGIRKENYELKRHGELGLKEKKGRYWITDEDTEQLQGMAAIALNAARGKIKSDQTCQPKLENLPNLKRLLTPHIIRLE